MSRLADLEIEEQMGPTANSQTIDQGFPSIYNYTAGLIYAELPVQFDALDGVTSKRVTGYKTGLGKAAREVINPDSRIVYHLENDQLGSVGAVELLKTGSNECQIQFYGPMRPKRRRFDEDEREQLKKLEGDSYVTEINEVIKKIDRENKDLFKKRKSHQVLMREAYFTGLLEDIPSLHRIAPDIDNSDDTDGSGLNGADNASTEIGSEGGVAGKKVANKIKHGPHKYSKADKLAALDAWENLDKYIFPTTLKDWLEERFGSEGNVLNVAPSTFYGWKRYRNKNS